MKKRLLALIGLFLSLPFVATAKSIDQTINDYVQPVTDFFTALVFVSFQFKIAGESVSVPVVLVILIGAALYFTFSLRFVNFRHFGTALKIVSGKYKEPDAPGEVTHFQALAAALSGTTGLGNIAGVAIAISIGGPGATFWMVIAGLIGMSLKFVECTLGVRYREIDGAGVVYGGPMYYLSKGFASMKMVIGGKDVHFAKIGQVLAIIFAISTICGSLGGGNMLQVNQAFKQFNDLTSEQVVVANGTEWVGKEVFPKQQQTEKYIVLAHTAGTFELGNEKTEAKVTLSDADFGANYITRPMDNYGWLVGLVFAFFVGIVIIGGIKSIARVADKIVPFMCGMYVIAALIVIFWNLEAVPSAFESIITGAFGYQPLAGGVVGVLFVGFKRAAFSNEAGIGSASIAHSAVKTNYPASEGLVSLLEPFIDTVIVCTMTALVIVITKQYENSSIEDGIALTSNAFATVIWWFPYLLFVAVVLFAFATMITWSYYGMQSWAYIFGRSKVSFFIYNALFCLFVVIGAAMDLRPVIDFSDASIFVMLFPNMVGLIFLSPVARHELAVYLAKIKEWNGAMEK